MVMEMLGNLLTDRRFTIGLVVCVLLVIGLIWYLRSSNDVENFVALDDNVDKVNEALASILKCEEVDCSEEEGVVRNFLEFKKELIAPDFSVIAFNNLLNKRREKGSPLTKEEINETLNV
jgi:hypothetical protein